MIYTALNKLDTSDVQWEIAHLFEHLVVEGFYRTLADQGIRPDLAGWVQADTFEDMLFIDTGFYNKQTDTLFSRYIETLPQFSDDLIAHCLSTIEVEERSLVRVQNQDILHRELTKLVKRPWNRPNPQFTPATPALTISRSAKSFRDITIETHAYGLTVAEQKVFLRLRTILIDHIFHALRISGIYARGDSSSFREDGHMAFLSQFTIKRGVLTLKDVEHKLQNTFSAFAVPEAMSAIQDHFTAFAAESLWVSVPVEYYRTTGILTSTKEIARLADEPTITSILSKVSFVVRAYRPTDSDYIV